MDAKREKALAEAREKSSHSGDLTRESPLDHIIKGLLMVSREDDLVYRIGRIYRQFDADQSGGLSLDELNAGLRQFGLPSDRKPQLTGEDWDVVTEHGRLLDSNGELSIKGFENMMLHQIRVYTHKKLVQSMMQIDGDESQESQMTTYLLLKSVMMTSHQASSMLERIGKVVDPNALDGHHELSKKERIQRLQRMWAPLYKYFATWKEAAGRGEGADGDAGASAKVGQELVLARLDNVEAKVSVVCDKLSGVEDSIQQLSRLLLNLAAVQLPGGQDRIAGGDGADEGAHDVSVRREVRNEAQQQEMEMTSASKTSQSPARPLSPPAMVSQQMFESGHGNSVVTISTTMAQEVDADEGMADDKTTLVVASARRAITSAADWYDTPAASSPPPISSPSGNGNVQRFTHPIPMPAVHRPDDRASPSSAQAATAGGAVHSGAFTPVQESEAKDAERLANMGIAAPKTFTKPNPAIEDSTGQPMSSIELMLQASEIPGSG